MTYYSEFLPYTILSVTLVGLYFALENKLVRPWMRWAWWAGSLVVALVVGWQVGTGHIWADFGNGYYFAGRKILTRPEQLFPGETCGGFVNFPLLAFVFVPFGTMPKEEAGRIFFLLNIISIMPLAYWLIKFSGLKGWGRWLVLVLLMVNGPLDYSLWLGNSTNLIMLSMILALHWYQRGREVGAGILLGINGLIKIPLIIPAGYFFIRRQWKVVVGGFVVVGIVVVLSLMFTSISLNRMWLNNCILSFSGNPVGAFNNQSAAGVLSRQLLPHSEIRNWLPLKPTPNYVLAFRIAIVLLYVPVIIVLFDRWRAPRTKREDLLGFFIVLACSLLTSPISWTHYYMLLLIPFALYFDESQAILGNGWLGLMWTGLILATIPVDLTLDVFEKFGQRLLLSPHFFGGLLIYMSLCALWLRHRRTGTRV